MSYGTINAVSASAEATSYNNANTSSIITSDNVQGAIDQLFQSVSEGKSLIAGALTDKGISTSASDSWQTIANNIASLSVHNIVTGEGFQRAGSQYYVNTPGFTASNFICGTTVEGSQFLFPGVVFSIVSLSGIYNGALSVSIYNDDLIIYDQDGIVKFTNGRITFSSFTYTISSQLEYRWVAWN